MSATVKDKLIDWAVDKLLKIKKRKHQREYDRIDDAVIMLHELEIDSDAVVGKEV